MSSGRSTLLQRKILYKIPFLYKIGPCGNYHKYFDRLCFCRVGECCGDWHGGIYDFKTKEEYQYCKQCNKV